MKNIFTLITIFAGLAGCSEEPSEELERIATSILLGVTWTSECIIDGTNSYIPTLTFTSNGGAFYDSGNGTSSNVYHTDNTTCSSLEPEIQDVNTFSYILGSNVIVDGSVAEITEAMEIDTTNTTEGSIDIGATEYDIFAIKNKLTLYFGNKDEPNNGSTIDFRPTQLSDAVIFTR